MVNLYRPGITRCLRNREFRGIAHEITCKRQLSASIDHRSPPQRVRFAPSPTGQLHLGGLRTALYNYLLAKQTNGQFILRIEDTDQTRKVPGADVKLTEMLKWTGLIPDESPEIGGHAGPYVQSQRTCLYQQYAQQLLDSGKAFKCFCSSERLQDLRDAQKRAGNPPRYDGKCAALVTTDFDELEKSQKRPYTIRLKLPTTFGNAIVFDDLIHGRISVPRSALDSAILIKSDGLPTYHLANVVDDHLMGITRVIRGKEWIASTPLHILLYEAFGWTPPEFAHLPLLTNLDGTKLSKRQESLSVESLKEAGYLPEAVVNFVAFLGWGHVSGKEMYTMDELIKEFDITQVRKSPASVSLSKLDFLNKCHLSHQLEDPSRLSDYITGFRDAILKDYRDPVTKRILPCVRIDKLNDDEFLSKVLVSVKDKAGKTDILHRLAAPYVVFLPDYPRLDAELVGALSGPNVEKIVKTFLLKLHQADETTWTPASAKDLAHQVSVNLNLKFGVVAKVLRPILTGSVVGADLGSMLVLLGKQELQQRIEHFLEWRAQSNDQ